MTEIGRIEKRKQIAIKWSKDAPTLCVHGCFEILSQEELNKLLRDYERIIMSMNQGETEKFFSETESSNDICLPRIKKLVEQYKSKY